VVDFDDVSDDDEEVIKGIEDLTYKEGYDYSKHYRTIGRPGGVFITAQGKILPSDQAPQGFVSNPNPFNKTVHEDIDPDLKEALENYNDGRYEELPDNFMEIAQLDIDENADSIEFGSYGSLDDIEGDEPVSKKPEVKNNTTITKPPVGQEDENEDEEDDEDEVFEEAVSRKRSTFDDYFEVALKKFNKDIEEMYEDPDEGLDDEDGDEENDEPPDLIEPSNPMASLRQFNSVFDEYIKSQHLDGPPSHHKQKGLNYETEKPTDEVALKFAYVADDESDDLEEVVVKERKTEWDCESIISTYSNLENHPAMIIEPQNRIKLNKKGFPKAPVDKEQSDPESESDETEKSNQGITRSKAETPEEKKKQRKKMVKLEKKIKREQKKEMKLAYRSEFLKQRTQAMGQFEGKTIIKFSS